MTRFILAKSKIEGRGPLPDTLRVGRNVPSDPSCLQSRKIKEGFVSVRNPLSKVCRCVSVKLTEELYIYHRRIVIKCRGRIYKFCCSNILDRDSEFKELLCKKHETRVKQQIAYGIQRLKVCEDLLKVVVTGCRIQYYLYEIKHNRSCYRASGYTSDSWTFHRSCWLLKN